MVMLIDDSAACIITLHLFFLFFFLGASGFISLYLFSVLSVSTEFTTYNFNSGLVSSSVWGYNLKPKILGTNSSRLK
jgi:hypothetical protein